MSDEDAVKMATEKIKEAEESEDGLKPKMIARALLGHAIRNGSTDNISVIVVKF